MKTEIKYPKLNSIVFSTSLFFLLVSQSFAAEFPARDSLNISKCDNAVVSDENRLGSFDFSNPQPNIGSILISAAITAGIDFIGEKLSESAEEAMETRTASVNIFPNSDKISARCLTFKTSEPAKIKNVTGQSVEFKIRLDGKAISNGIPFYMTPKLTDLKYYRTLSGKLNKERGLMIQIAITSPDSANGQSQTISINNVSTQDDVYAGAIEFPTMINPYVSKKTDGKGNVTGGNVGSPFTISVTLTEVKDANEALGFVSSVFSAANDDLTSAVITAVSGPADDDGTSELDVATVNEADGNATNH